MTTPTGPGITAPQAAAQVGQNLAQTPVGQNLTPNQNVFAIMRMGGDTWGANGGGAVPVLGPLPVLANASRAVRSVDNNFDVNNQTIQGAMSRGVVNTKTEDLVNASDSTSQVWTADLESPGIADSQL